MRDLRVPNPSPRSTSLPLVGFFGRAIWCSFLLYMSISDFQRTWICSAARMKSCPRTLDVSSTDTPPRCEPVIVPHHHLTLPRLTVNT